MAKLLDFQYEYSLCKFELNILNVTVYNESETTITFTVNLINRYCSVVEQVTCLESDIIPMLERLQNAAENYKPMEVHINYLNEPGFFMNLYRNHVYETSLKTDSLLTVFLVIDSGFFSDAKKVSTATGPALCLQVSVKQLIKFKNDIITEINMLKEQGSSTTMQ